jgi:hypothetical protein
MKTTRKVKTKKAAVKPTTTRQTRLKADDAVASVKPSQDRPVTPCGAHVAGDECRICGYGMDVCTKCGVQTVSKATGVCASCGKKAR